MVKANLYQSKINAGELSPEMSARTDFPKYQNAAATFENAFPIPEGGFQRRAGTRYIAEVKDSSKVTRIKGFEFSTEQAYFIEMGDYYFRFIRNQSPLLVATTDAVVTNGTFDTGITGWTDSSNGTGSIVWNASGQRCSLSAQGTGNEAIASQNINYTTGVEHSVQFSVVGAAGDIITCNVGSTLLGSDILAATNLRSGYHVLSFTPSSSPIYLSFVNGMGKAVDIDDIVLLSGVPLEVKTPYSSAHVFDVHGPQSADVLYMVHGLNPLTSLLRLGDTSWSVIEVENKDGPYMLPNSGTTTLTPAATTGYGITVTASAITGINDDRGFLSTDVGRLIRISNPASGTSWGYCRIVAVASTTSVTVDIKRDFDATTATTDWKIGAWSGTTGYVGSASFYQQRFVAGATTKSPQSVWFGEVNGFSSNSVNMSIDSANVSGVWDGTVQDDDAINYAISADNVNAIKWITASEVMIIGTTGGEWVPESSGQVLTPSDINIRRRTAYGSSNTVPTQVGAAVVFLQKARRKIRSFEFSYQSNGYKAFDMTRLARHITRTGVVEMAYQREPDSIIWCVRTDGTLLSFIFNLDENVVGWSRNIIGGLNAVAKSVATIPGTNGAGQVASSSERDEVGIIVSRTIGGVTKQYIEIIERVFESYENQSDSYYSDSVITYSGASTSTITGLSHLEGETVTILADGAIQPLQTVTGGSITLSPAASVVQVGLPYKSKYKSLRLDGGARAGTAVGKVKTVDAITLIILLGHTFSIGLDGYPLVAKDFRQVSDAMDTAVPYFTGEQLSELEGDWTTDPRIIVETDAPTSFTLLALAPDIKTNDLL